MIPEPASAAGAPVPAPASQNPWYILATIHGEPTEEGWNDEIAAKNRRIWNGWSCGHLPKAKRAELAKLAKLDEEALGAWNDTEQAEVEKVFATGRGIGMTLPDPDAEVDFKDTHFAAPLSMSQFVFSQAAVFTSATFDGYAWFDGAMFSGDAWFGSAGFSGDAWFGSARFSGYAWFDSATFSGDARFSSATVSGDAVFNGATFSGDAWFDGARFSGYAWFDRGTFSGDAWFDSATFGGDAWFGSATFERFAYFTGATFEKIASFSDCQFGRTTSFREARFQSSVSGVFRRDPAPEHHLHRQGSVLAGHEQRRARGQPQLAGDHPACNLETGTAGGGALFLSSRDEVSGEDRHGLREAAVYPLPGALRFRKLHQRPTVGLLVLWVAFGLPIGQDITVDGSTKDSGMLPAFGLSFANIFGFLGFHSRFMPKVFDDAPAWLVAASGFQSVFGFVLLFFLGLGLRARFRLQ